MVKDTLFTQHTQEDQQHFSQYHEILFLEIVFTMVHSSLKEYDKHEDAFKTLGYLEEVFGDKHDPGTEITADHRDNFGTNGHSVTQISVSLYE